MDLDLDAYADDGDTSARSDVQPVDCQVGRAIEPKRISVLEAAERAGIPLKELLPKLDR